MQLNEKQQEAFELIRDGHNVFLTGAAGTGKSFLIHYLKEHLSDVDITASTGIAASHLGGQTLFSWGGFCPGKIDGEYDQNVNPFIRAKLQRCRVLVIDEISMVNDSFLEYVEESLRIIRGKLYEPFGGLQVVVVGDFMQLPPVTGGFSFKSKAWEKADFMNIRLTEIKRQEDKDMAAMLNRMQVNKMTNEDIQLLKSRNITREFDPDVVQLFPKNDFCDKVNREKLHEIDGETHEFQAILQRDPRVNEKQAEMGMKKYISDSLIEKNLVIKEGARVMMLSNEYLEQYQISNGSTGEIVEIESHQITVKFDNGVILGVQRKDYEVSTKNIKTREEVLLGNVKQFPLKLCWAITIHKSQGMSLDKVAIDFRGIFAPFQAYVALSRARSLDGAQIKNFDPKYVMIDQDAVDFMNSIY